MKKIVIFTSKGGGGHIAVSDALFSYLAQEYEVEVALTFTEVIQSLDILRKISFGRYNWIRLYNDLLRKKYFGIINIIQAIGSTYITMRCKSIKRILIDYLSQEKAAMAISVVPLINSALMQATKELNIPLIIIPTDLNASLVVKGMKQSTDSHFRLAYSFKNNTITKIFSLAQIQNQQTVEVGFPLRQSFFESHNIDQIKKKYAIPAHKAVAFLSMGYQGSTALEAFVRELKKIPVSLHIIICTGKDGSIAKKITALDLPPHISTSIVGFTPYIAELMSIADLFIGKSGSVSVCEAIYMNLPLFLDATTKVLEWERLNHTFVEKNGFGYSIRHTKEIVPLITRFLIDAPYRGAIKNNLRIFQKKNASKEIIQLIKSML
jgi:processive 1,2-diacylglycerol beta-glucosyltransferase